MIRAHVRCPSCCWTGHRHRHEDEPVFGACPRCGAAVARQQLLADARAAKAKADLQRFEAHA